MIPSPTVRHAAALVRSSPARCGSTRVVCIDGPAGSGKSTLAAALAAELDAAPVVHLDDLYTGWDQDLGAPLSARVRAWLLDAWQAGLPGRHLRFDWEVGQYAAWVEVPAEPVVILEGCGSAARGIRDRAATLIWVEAPLEVRLVRGLDRDGVAMERQWRAWVDREAAHFATDDTRATADLVVDGVTGRATTSRQWADQQPERGA